MAGVGCAVGGACPRRAAQRIAPIAPTRRPPPSRLARRRVGLTMPHPPSSCRGMSRSSCRTCRSKVDSPQASPRGVTAPLEHSGASMTLCDALWPSPYSIDRRDHLQSVGLQSQLELRDRGEAASWFSGMRARPVGPADRPPSTFRLRDGCSASIWMAPDGSRLLRLDALSVQTALKGSRPIVWMIIGMIKRIRQDVGWQGKHGVTRC